MGERWPNLFVVGAARAGTTTLWRHLGAHPGVFMSPVKEPRHFVSGAYRGIPAVTGERAYLGLFSKARGERYLGEASVSYFSAPEAPERIRARSPEARIVISLREPVAQAYSGYWMEVRLGFARESFEERVERGFAPPPYSEPVARWLDVFGERVHVLFFEELVADTRAAMAALYSELELDPGPAQSLVLKRHNPSGQPRNAAMGLLMRSPRFRVAARRVLPDRLRRGLGAAALRADDPPELAPDTIATLRERVRADVGPLEGLLGRSVPWPS